MRKSKATQEWRPGDIFAVQQRDGVCSIGQVIELIMKNVVSCAFYDIRIPCDKSTGATFDLRVGQLIAVISVTREQLDFGKWRVVGHHAVSIDPELWPNEEFRSERWVGAKIYDAAIAEELLDAFNGLVPWDDWHDPEYLDKLLVSPERKPKHVLRKKS
jgi:hypothetical protein